jgi:DNA-binding NarL/FixJ family response regulator
MGPSQEGAAYRRSAMEATAPAAGLRIVIADDHPLMRAAIAGALMPIAPGIQFVEVASHAEALALLDETPVPDLLLMDLRMPGGDGVDGVREVRHRAPQVPVAIVSAEDDPSVVRALLMLGVSGFIPKTDSPAVIALAVRLILAGGIYVPPHLVASTPVPPPGDDAGTSGLTARQMQVVRLLARGLSNKAIARELGVSEGTIKVHLLAMFRVLGVRNRTSAVLEAQRFLE